ncbi:pentatricopeptide repeat-containing protein At4g37170-like [Chenopodium quinoa]|uniref:pentatricopeptide repeat-containing protein At4g37170-like n=1 Tax=Chenopodium quinoa TaxID=63459 RepID=UPI000B794298|nr:pentatricopeptide repeat-containing protein At4g37170-like [Chenopodium quinoa]XP_021749207.1 pentatricopeptide repeat-containing protein At4g37170-like [Chenopodium quinoa]XP_021749208.1 pentatricopeptide repeat-containing protein At4g37170-like [Chenopodium quinoa]
MVSWGSRFIYLSTKRTLWKFRRVILRKVHVGTDVNKYDLCTTLNSCTKIRNSQLGLQIHAKIIQYGYGDNLILSSALVDFYAKCFGIEDARSMFNEMKQHDEVSWTSIISGYLQYGCGVEANFLFKKMLTSDIQPNCFTYVSVIAACSAEKEPLKQGLLVHAHVIKLGFMVDNFVVSSLIDFYSKCGCVDAAVLIFNEAATRDSIVYNSMIACHCHNLYVENAVRLFLRMRNQGISSTDFTMSSILHASGRLSVLQVGRQVHGLVIKLGSLTNLFVLSSLIDMYSKSGSIDEARYVFDQTIEKNYVLWTSLISGYAQSGRAIEALELFDHMLGKGFFPDHICFTAVLSACNHAGLLDRAVENFKKMIKDYDLSPTMDQYACLIDLYSRQGHIKKAMQLMDEMPFDPNSVILSSLLSCCKTYGAVELGRVVANQLFALQPQDSAAYLTMAHIYAEAGLWDEVANIRKLMKPKGVEKCAAWSWVEVDEHLNN